MLFNPKHEDDVDRLMEQLRVAPALTRDLISNVIVHACTRLPAMLRSGKVTRLDQFIAADAWTDAALALIELDLPMWKLRQLTQENGGWFCSLSLQPNLPAALDETADAWHDVLPLAIMGAFVEARRRRNTERHNLLPTVPQVRPTSGHVMCCDNFA
jgi:hypothetical protein